MIHKLKLETYLQKAHVAITNKQHPDKQSCIESSVMCIENFYVLTTTKTQDPAQTRAADIKQ